MSDDWTMRQETLSIGREYRILTSSRGMPNSRDFSVGETVTLRDIQYSRYDNAFVYVFEDMTGASKSFWLSDDQPISALHSVFSAKGTSG